MFAYLLALLIPAFASALPSCPELAGQYKCASKQGFRMQLTFAQQPRGVKTEYRFAFKGNRFLGEGESKVLAPHHWKQGGSTLFTVCQKSSLRLTDSGIDQAGDPLKVIYRFDKTGEGRLRFRMDVHSAEKGTILDYDCKI